MKNTTLISKRAIMHLCTALLFLSLNKVQAQSNIVLYGMTQNGGPGGFGTVFKCTSTGNLTTLVYFDNTHGANPWGSLIKAYDGNLYGMTLNGGRLGMGNIFKMSPQGAFSDFVDFDNTNGANPYGSLYQAADSNFYGMTYNGGIYASCVCFKCSPSGREEVIFDFLGPTGDFPYGNVMQASNGNLYGMTTMGGNYSLGILFVKAPGDTLTKLLDFNDTNGALPFGSLIQANDGNLYGMTSEQPSMFYSYITPPSQSYGTIFRCTPEGQLTTVYKFDSLHGETPFGSLIQATDGFLYGMTSAGGSAVGSLGTIFKCSLSGALTTLVSFNGTNGGNPHGSLIQASDGLLYGMTSSGGKYGFGTLFKCDLAGNLTTLVDFNRINGANPYGDLLALSEVTGVDNAVNKSQVNLYPNPNTGLFTITTPDLNGVTHIEVYNILGDKISTTKVNAVNTQMDLSNNTSGIYLYRVITETGNLISEGKFIIQK